MMHNSDVGDEHSKPESAETKSKRVYQVWKGSNTTYENFRYRYENKLNPYDQGVLQNFKEILCSYIPPSKNYFRARVEEDEVRCIDVKVHQMNNDLFSPGKKSKDDLGFDTKSLWLPMAENEGVQYLHHQDGSGIKQIYDNVFAEAFRKPHLCEQSDASSVIDQRISLCQSGNWDVSAEMLGVNAAGNQNIDNNDAHR